MDSNGQTTIWGMQTAIHAPKPMKKTAKDSHCLEMLLDTCCLINRISPAGFAYISLATHDFSFIHLTAFFGQHAPYCRYICNNNKYLSYINFVHWCIISNNSLQPQTQWPSRCLPFSSIRHYDTKYICWIMLYYIIYKNLSKGFASETITFISNVYMYFHYFILFYFILFIDLGGNGRQMHYALRHHVQDSDTAHCWAYSPLWHNALLSYPPTPPCQSTWPHPFFETVCPCWSVLLCMYST